jgi:hypothetical protein
MTSIAPGTRLISSSIVFRFDPVVPQAGVHDFLPGVDTLRSLLCTTTAQVLSEATFFRLAYRHGNSCPGLVTSISAKVHAPSSLAFRTCAESPCPLPCGPSRSARSDRHAPHHADATSDGHVVLGRGTSFLPGSGGPRSAERRNFDLPLRRKLRRRRMLGPLLSLLGRGAPTPVRGTQLLFSVDCTMGRRSSDRARAAAAPHT